MNAVVSREAGTVSQMELEEPLPKANNLIVFAVIYTLEYANIFGEGFFRSWT